MAVCQACGYHGRFKRCSPAQQLVEFCREHSETLIGLRLEGRAGESLAGGGALGVSFALCFARAVLQNGLRGSLCFVLETSVQYAVRTGCCRAFVSWNGRT